MTQHTSMKNRVSIHQRDMHGDVDLGDLKSAFGAITAVPVHGKIKPYKYVVFAGDKTEIARDVLFKKTNGKYTMDEFNALFGGVGAFIFVFSKVVDGRIPNYELEWSTACATYSVQVSLFEMGYATKWNTILKDEAIVPTLRNVCGVDETYTPMGYVMVGCADLHTKDRQSWDVYVDFK